MLEQVTRTQVGDVTLASVPVVATIVLTGPGATTTQADVVAALSPLAGPESLAVAQDVSVFRVDLLGSAADTVTAEEIADVVRAMPGIDADDVAVSLSQGIATVTVIDDSADDATAAAVTDAIELIASVGDGNVLVTLTESQWSASFVDSDFSTVGSGDIEAALVAGLPLDVSSTAQVATTEGAFVIRVAGEPVVDVTDRQLRGAMETLDNVAQGQVAVSVLRSVFRVDLPVTLASAGINASTLAPALAAGLGVDAASVKLVASLRSFEVTILGEAGGAVDLAQVQAAVAAAAGPAPVVISTVAREFSVSVLHPIIGDVPGLGADNDTLIGDAGNNLLDGGAGRDNLSVTSGNNILLGGTDSDTLTGGTGNDQLFGGAGTDLLDGKAGTNVIYTGGGGDGVTSGPKDEVNNN